MRTFFMSKRIDELTTNVWLIGYAVICIAIMLTLPISVMQGTATLSFDSIWVKSFVGVMGTWFFVGVIMIAAKVELIEIEGDTVEKVLSPST
jgi:hypothetical protein